MIEKLKLSGLPLHFMSGIFLFPSIQKTSSNSTLFF